MTAAQLIAAVRATRGSLYAGVLGKNDVFYIAVKKSDLLNLLGSFPADHEPGLILRETCGAHYLEAAA